MSETKTPGVEVVPDARHLAAAQALHKEVERRQWKASEGFHTQRSWEQADKYTQDGFLGMARVALAAADRVGAR
ncbi:hypothetical protein NQ036_06905 [Brevibacterium sp. 91QC2O2]|uniref:hypothetical protein n=1 Tax=Brevibacterium sp. 91QC2O2 TaxID=2968458 RepID=UPI00211B84D3|nr:hypothetical protein [Brevibacterium sp. 91QC2O2]MCQ9367973.1 hypothetical protein [Brevibacterium sp. 91QC2O2]